MTTEYLLKREAELVLACLTPVNRAVVKVCMHTGLRVSDVLSLRKSQIKPILCVKEGKTGKYKRVGLPDGLRREILALGGGEWAFPGRNHIKPHTRQAVWKDVKRAAVAFRLPQNVAPHSFRKQYAVELLAKYGDIERVKRALNHTNSAVTAIYAMSDKLLFEKLTLKQSKMNAK